jgi:outer membrane protein TolC
MKAEKASQADLMQARVDLLEAHSQILAARVAVTAARAELQRATGCLDAPSPVAGELEVFEPPADCAGLADLALERRPDLWARREVVAEAEARMRLERANRWGNPSIGTDYEYDPTRISFVGAHVTMPLPVLNKHKGEILQREAELARAVEDLRQEEVRIRLEVRAALDRLQAAVEWESAYRREILPGLAAIVEQRARRPAEGKDGDGALPAISAQLKLVKARDGFLDAHWEVSQARCDLAAAMGDPDLAIGCTAGHASGYNDDVLPERKVR